MNDIYFGLIMGVLLIVIHITIVATLARLKSQIPPIAIHAFSAIAMLLLLLLLFLAGRHFDFWLACCTLAFGVSAYLFVFGAIYKSLSLRMLLVADKKGGCITFNDLDLLVTDASFAERTKILCDMKFAVKEGESYKISSSGLRQARKINLMRKLFGISTPGLYGEDASIGKVNSNPIIRVDKTYDV